MSNAAAVQARLLGRRRRARPLILDFTETEYLDSAWFPRSRAWPRPRSAGRGGCGWSARRGSPTRRPLEIAGIDRLLPLHDSVEGALASGGRPEA